MEYMKADLGVVDAGSTVVVELEGTEANVYLLDPLSLRAYESGRQYRYYGGHYNRSPVAIPVPSTGSWFVVVDLGGFAGRVAAAVRVVAA